MNEAFVAAVIPRNILSGFRSTGVCPFNPDISPKDVFEPSAVTDRPIPEQFPTAEISEPSTIQYTESTSADTSTSQYRVSTSAETSPSQCSVSTSAEPQFERMDQHSGSVCEAPRSSYSTRGYVSAEHIIPLPKTSSARGKKRHDKVKTRILTDTPEKLAIEKAHHERAQKKAPKKQTEKQFVKGGKKKGRKQIIEEESSFSDGDTTVVLNDCTDD